MMTMTDKRTEITNAMKEAMKARDEMRLSTARLIIAKMKEQDIEVRTKGNMDGIGDSEILSMMQGMIKQRQESAKIYREGNRAELAEKEEAEIKVIESFLPAQLSDADVDKIVGELVEKLGATSIKDMGKVMAELKAHYAGQVDMAKAGAVVRAKLGG
jgi:uncharacterized protein